MSTAPKTPEQYTMLELTRDGKGIKHHHEYGERRQTGKSGYGYQTKGAMEGSRSSS